MFCYWNQFILMLTNNWFKINRIYNYFRTDFTTYFFFNIISGEGVLRKAFFKNLKKIDASAKTLRLKHNKSQKYLAFENQSPILVIFIERFNYILYDTVLGEARWLMGHV